MIASKNLKNALQKGQLTGRQDLVTYRSHLPSSSAKYGIKITEECQGLANNFHQVTTDVQVPGHKSRAGNKSGSLDQ